MSSAPSYLKMLKSEVPTQTIALTEFRGSGPDGADPPEICTPRSNDAADYQRAASRPDHLGYVVMYPCAIKATPGERQPSSAPAAMTNALRTVPPETPSAFTVINHAPPPVRPSGKLHTNAVFSVDAMAADFDNPTGAYRASDAGVPGQRLQLRDFGVAQPAASGHPAIMAGRDVIATVSMSDATENDPLLYDCSTTWQDANVIDIDSDDGRTIRRKQRKRNGREGCCAVCSSFCIDCCSIM